MRGSITQDRVNRWSHAGKNSQDERSIGLTNKKETKRKKKFFCFVFKNGTQQLAVATFHFLPYTGTVNMINNGTHEGRKEGKQKNSFVGFSSPCFLSPAFKIKEARSLCCSALLLDMF